jgi:hypothetical protein
MSKRSKACDITPNIRQQVFNRDKKCINCGSNHMLTIAHVYVSRAHGGKGVMNNLAVLCTKCHGHLDNGKLQEKMIVKFNVERYMERIYGKPNLDEIKFRKWG